MKKIFAFDLDGTLAESKQTLTKEMAELLFELASKARVIVISGGSYIQFERQFFPAWNEVIKTKGLNVTSNLVLMPTNGTQQYLYNSDTDTWELVNNNTFSNDTKKTVIEKLKSIITNPAFEIPTEHFGEYIEDRGSQITFSALGQEAPLDLKSAWDPNQTKRQRIKSEIERTIQNISISIGGTTSIDILPQGIDKGVSLVKFLEQEGISKEECLFVGDALYEGGNDYSVIKIGIETVAVSTPEDTAFTIKKWLNI
jgi:HAD superfamily hydrolase (TIGR01484 family)